MSVDYAMEKKLAIENPELHKIYKNNVTCCQEILTKYRLNFPSFTDHSSLHSLEIISFCNELIRDNIEKLNTDEIFILLMAAYLHDAGMGVSDSDFEIFSNNIDEIKQYKLEHPDERIRDVVRKFHHELSGQFVQKYAFLFDFPSEEHLFAIKQICRGHRKTNLFDADEYPAEYKLSNGNIVHLPYLAALIRLGDELDIAIDRNIQFLFDDDIVKYGDSKEEFRKHEAIKSVKFADDHFDITIDYTDPELKDGLIVLLEKLQYSLDNCVKVIDERTPFTIYHRRLVITGLEPREL